MMKKQLLTLTLLLSILAPMPSAKAGCPGCYSGAAVGGAVVGGIFAGILLGTIISKSSKKKDNKKKVVIKKTKTNRTGRKTKNAKAVKAGA